MGWSTNQKAQQKREKEKAEKQEKAQKKQQQAQRKKWQDSQTEKKMSSQRQKQQKREKQLARKRELKQIAQREQQQLAKISRKKQTFAEKKLTQAQIAKNIEQRQNKIAKQESNNSHDRVFYQENPNRNLEEYEVASNVEEALRVLDVGEEKHPQKRYKAAYEAYCAKREIQLRVQYPKLKRTQRLQMMHKEFQKSPDNPFNKNTVAYNDKSRKEAKKAKEEEKKREQEEQQKEKVQVKREDED